MIEIVTLFLGLFSGAQTVELEVAAPVAEVELRLDGEAVTTLTQPPWSTRVDLGPALAPHELIAVARDAGGGELGRDRRLIHQAVNDSATAVVLSLDPGVRLPAAAEMQSWFSVGGERLEVLRVEPGAAEVVIVRDPLVQPYLDRTASFFFQVRLECHLRWDAVTLTDKQAFVAACRRQLLQHGNRQAAAGVGAVWEQWHDAFSFGDDAGGRFISPRAAPVSRVVKRHGIFNLTTQRPSSERGLLWHSAMVRPLHFPPRISDAVAMAGLEAHAGQGRRAVVLMIEDEAMGPSRYPPATVRDFLEDLQVPLYVWNFGLVDPGTPAAESPAAESPDAGKSADAPVKVEDFQVPVHVSSFGRVDRGFGTPAAGSPAAGTPAAGKPAGAPVEGPGAPGGWGDVRDLRHLSMLDTGAIEDWLGRVAAAADEVRKQLRRQRVVWLRGVHAPHRVELSAQAGIRLAGGRRPGLPPIVPGESDG